MRHEIGDVEADGDAIDPDGPASHVRFPYAVGKGNELIRDEVKGALDKGHFS